MSAIEGPMEPGYTRKDFLRLSFARLVGRAGDVAEAAVRALPAARRALSSDPEGHGDAAARIAARTPRTGIVRPPGALPEPEFLARCTKCDDCIRACPHWVIRKAGPELGGGLGGTPILLPQENPCLFCADLPCITACTTGALQRAPEGARVRIGTALVAAGACYQAQGQPCDYCEKNCPVRPRAIRANERGRAATVDTEACTGCGVCAQLCPARAITIHDRRLERGMPC